MDVYRSKYALARELSDHQIQILLLLQLGYQAVTNEGVDYKAWIENARSEKVPFKLRKDTLNYLYSVGLLESKEDGKGRYNTYCYTCSHKALEVLKVLPSKRYEACFWSLSKRNLIRGL